MNDILLKIVQSQKEEYLAQTAPLEVARDIEGAFRESFTAPLIKVVIGPRRAGKSTLVRRILSGTPHAHLNFEDDRLPAAIDTDDLLHALKITWGEDAYQTLFFDEIQNLDRWEQFLHRLHRARKNIFVTGSNSRLLSKELGTSLTGRYHCLTLLPFSWQETQRARALVKLASPDTASQIFHQYLMEGGFPDVALKNAEAASYMSQLWGAILSRDIVDRYRVRNIPALRALGELVLQAVGSRVSGRSLQKALPHRLSNTTLENYLAYGEEAFLFHLLQKFEPSLAKQKKADRKPYAYDTGFIRSVRPSLVSASQGQLLENFVFLELIRRGAQPNIDLFYFHSPKQEEVDFVYLMSGLDPELIQVCWTLKERKTYDREVRALVTASAIFGVKKAKIVTFDEDFTTHEGGLEIVVQRATVFAKPHLPQCES